MNRRNLISVMIFLLVIAGISLLNAGTYLIWDPCGSPSAESLREILQAENYNGIMVSDIQPYLDNLDDYKPLFVIANWWCDGFDLEVLDGIAVDIHAYLLNLSLIHI